MNKLIAFLLAFTMTFTFAACGKNEENPDPVPEETVQLEENVSAEEQLPAEEQLVPEEMPAEEESTEPEDLPEEPSTEEPVVEELPVQESVEVTSAIDLLQVRDSVISQLGIEGAMYLDTTALGGLYGISADWVAQSASFVTMSGTFPDEIVLVQAVDEAAAESIRACLQTRLNEVMVQSQSYDPENYAAAQACQVLVNGTFVSLILSPEQADMTSVYLSCFN